MRALLAVALVLLAPTAVAAATIDEVRAPPRTVAGKVFDASVTLSNRGEPVDVVLAAALYDLEEGKTCGPATDPRFRTYTHLVHDAIHLDRDESVTYPPPGSRWSHRYEVAETPAGGEGEWCVFLARAPGAGAQVHYEDFASVRLAVRPTNSPPSAAFAWTPARPAAAQPVAFSAEAADADGDPVTLRWDFGFANASGRARGEGTSPTVRFYPAGTYEVVLVASDGFDETRIARTVAVAAEAPPPATVVTTREATPLPLWVPLAALGLAGARRHQRDPE